MKIAVEMNESDWGQILDALRCRVELYDETVRYYETGNSDIEIAEVRDKEEARDLAKMYRGIILELENGLARKTID